MTTPSPISDQAAGEPVDALWTRHGSVGNEWWSLGAFSCHKKGDIWTLRNKGNELARHEYLQEVMKLAPLGDPVNSAWEKYNKDCQWGHEPTARGIFEDGYRAALSTAPTTGSAPVAWIKTRKSNGDTELCSEGPVKHLALFDWEPLYTHPASPAARVLTDEQIDEVFEPFRDAITHTGGRKYGFARAIESRVIALLAASMDGEKS